MTKVVVVFKITIPNEEGEEYKYLEADNFIIGRSPDVEVCLKDKGVSRSHLKVSAIGKKIQIRDLGSAYGTRVNGTVIPKDSEFVYKPGSPIKLGGWEEPIRIELFHAPLSEKEEGGLLVQEAKIEAEGLLRTAQQDALAIKSDTEEKISKALDQAQDKASEIIEKAKQQARIFEKQAEQSAQERAQSIVNQALEEANTERAAGKSSAEEIIQEARREVEPLKARLLSDAMSEAEKLKREIIASAEQKAKALAEATGVKLDAMIAEYQEKGRAYVREKERVGDELFKKTEERAANLVSESQKLVDERLAAARKEGEEVKKKIELAALEHKEQVIEEGRIEGQRLVAESRLEAGRIVEQAQNEGRKVVKAVEDDMQANLTKIQVLKEQIGRLEEDKRDVLKKSEQVKEERRQYEREIEEVRSQKEKLKDEVSKARLDARKQLNAIEAEVRKVEADLRAKEIDCEEVVRQRQMQEEALKEVLRTQEEARNTLALLEKSIESQKTNLAKEIEELKGQRDEVAESLQEVRDTFENKKEKISEELTGLREKKVQKLEADLSKMRLKAEEDLNMQKEALSREIAQVKTNLEREVNETRSAEMVRLENQKRREEEQLYQRRSHHIEEITRNLDMVLRSRAGKIEKFLTEGDELPKELKEIVKKVVNQEYDVHQEQVKTIMTFDPDDVKKVKRFWQKSVAASVVLIALAVGHFSHPNWHERLLKEILPEKSATDLIKEEIKQEQLKNAFNPELTPNFKDSYTENVLYTQEYLKLERNPQYHDLWIKELNKFLLDDLSLAEETTVNLVAAESVLLGQLEVEREKLTNKMLKEGIKKMEDIESAGVDKMTQLLKREANYDKYFKFKKEFYNRFTTKSPASL